MSDYIGFTYNGVHSSNLGIVRVSNGSRFDENLLPTMQDKTVPVPGGDGTYYFGSYYTQRQFNVSFAFDALTDVQLENLRTHFGDKKIHDLVFDETPYKAYQAKVTGTATIKHIPFDSEAGRIFKGEGSIQFTCYNPFAICKKKYLSDYENGTGADWAAASGLLATKYLDGHLNDNRYTYEIFILDEDNEGTKQNGKFVLYNPGIKEADWIVEITPSSDSGKIGTHKFKLGEKELSLSRISLKGDDTKITINSKTNLVEGYALDNGNYIKTGNLYNEYIEYGDFFKIPVDTSKTLELKVERVTQEPISISYNYYYF